MQAQRNVIPGQREVLPERTVFHLASEISDNLRRACSRQGGRVGRHVSEGTAGLLSGWDLVPEEPWRQSRRGEWGQVIRAFLILAGYKKLLEVSNIGHAICGSLWEGDETKGTDTIS